jgi:chitinase
VLRHIDLRALQACVDSINLMAYDFAGPWSDRTGHQSQIFSGDAATPPPSSSPISDNSPDLKESSTTSLSCQAGVSYVLREGVFPSKLLLGIPVYGRSFLDADDVHQHYSGGGGESGCFDYCDLPRPGAAVHHDDRLGAAYCVGGDGGFVSYDSPHIVALKAQFVARLRLAGLFYWHIAADKRGPESLVETGYRSLHDV